ncbi:MAG: hypothetical protein AB1560_00945 [Pseudomonadota bacterium]
MNEFEEKIKNASDAVEELIAFFVRCKVDWAKYYYPINDALKDLDVDRALRLEEAIPKVNMGGLLDLYICSANGHITTDEEKDNKLFLTLVGQVSKTFENLKQYVEHGVNKPIIPIVRST